MLKPKPIKEAVAPKFLLTFLKVMVVSTGLRSSIKFQEIDRLFIRRPVTSFIFVLALTSQCLSYAGSKEQLGEEYRLKGFEAKQNGNFDEALSFYTKAISLGINNPSVYNDMGVLYEEAGYDGRAEKYYIKALQSNNNYLPALSNLAFFYQKNGEKEKAYELFKRRFELAAPSDPWGQKAKEELLKIHPEYQQIIVQKEALDFQQEIVRKRQEEFYRKIALAGEHFQRGEKYCGEGNYRTAIKEYDQALSLTPNNPQVLKARKTAILELSKQNMQTQYQKAMEMMTTGNTRSAKDQIQRMLSTIPNEYPQSSQY